jgi:hypothetical protein
MHDDQGPVLATISEEEEARVCCHKRRAAAVLVRVLA